MVEVAGAPTMRHSFTGRVRNFNLPATAPNTLLPVFEALTNSLYAIQEKHPKNWPDEGVITVEVLRARPTADVKPDDHTQVTGFVISDNGRGLTDELFSYFLELDTEYRAEKKGRGIGRLSWLKVFLNANVVSIFERADQKMERSFVFQLSNERPISEYAEGARPADEPTGTIVSLTDFRELFGAKVFRNPEEIRNHILAHFISLFAQPKRLRINLIDEGVTTNLSDFFFDSIVSDKNPVQVDIGDGRIASLQHLLIPRKLAPIGNSLVYCAAERAVRTEGINEVIGMKNLPDQEHGELIYIGLASGEVFEDSLNHERTGFNFGDVDYDEVNGHLLDEVRRFLSPYLEQRRRKNKELLDTVLNDNPLYAAAIGDPDKYIASMPLNWDETRVVQDVAIKRHRARKALFKQIEKLEKNTASMSDEEFALHVNRITSELGETEKSALAQYVVERRMVIELLKTRRKLDMSSGKHQRENIVHEVFCPLGVTSDVIDYDDHNLWLIDDRLAYYSYVASDRPIRTFAKDDSQPVAEEVERRRDLASVGAYSDRSEPDLAIFRYPMLFRRAQTLDPVVIVEFKSPDKTTYSGAPNDNPVMQIRKYIETLQKKSCYDSGGNRITDITANAPFHCFLIAEPSEQLYSLLRSHMIYKPTPDGSGRFGYMDDLNAYFEFIPYEQVLSNASMRNEAFFKKLGLDSLT